MRPFWYFSNIKQSFQKYGFTFVWIYNNNKNCILLELWRLKLAAEATTPFLKVQEDKHFYKQFKQLKLHLADIREGLKYAIGLICSIIYSANRIYDCALKLHLADIVEGIKYADWPAAA